jgi:hypothetical protein
MLYKEAAIAVMVAVMLGAASLSGGLSISAFAADPDPAQVASKHITQGDESMIIDKVDFSAKKSSTRADGTVTVSILQDDKILDTDSISTKAIGTFLTDVKASFGGLNVTGDFEILIEYLGTGYLSAGNIEVIEGTQVAGTQVTEDNGDSTSGTEDNIPSQSDELENIITSKTISQASDSTMTVNTVDFSAKKSSTRADGTLTVAIVQDDKVLGSDQLSTRALSTFLEEREASFDDVNVTDDFKVVFMYDGTGYVTISGIDVPGATETAGSEDDNSVPTTGTVKLTVNSVDQNNQPITGLWFTVTSGLTTQGGWTEKTLELEAGQEYTVSMDDYYDSATGTMYTFVQWTDNTQGKSRIATLNTDETFTAKYNVVGNSPPPVPDDSTDNPPPPSPRSGPGSLTAYAYRIPSSYWGPTFVSANAQMYFVLYNSTGYMIYGGFFDENGNTVTGLNDGETYWIVPTDCHHCHGGTHDVVFNHWEDDSTERARSVSTGMSVGAYYEYVPDTP